MNIGIQTGGSSFPPLGFSSISSFDFPAAGLMHTSRAGPSLSCVVTKAALTLPFTFPLDKKNQNIISNKLNNNCFFSFCAGCVNCTSSTSSASLLTQSLLTSCNHAHFCTCNNVPDNDKQQAKLVQALATSGVWIAPFVAQTFLCTISPSVTYPRT